MIESHPNRTRPQSCPSVERGLIRESTMAITTSEVIRANLVLVGLRLLSAPEEIDSFKRAIGTDFQLAVSGMSVNIQTGIAEPGFTLALNRDRITLDLSASRSMVNRDFPSREELPRLAEVAGQAISHTLIEEDQLRAFGFNIELVFDQQSAATAFEYLSKRLFDVGPLGNEGWQLIGGGGKLIFSDGKRCWTISLEPRFNDEAESRVFVSVNLHKAEGTLPTQGEIRESLEELWDEVHHFIDRLDERGM